MKAAAVAAAAAAVMAAAVGARGTGTGGSLEGQREDEEDSAGEADSAESWCVGKEGEEKVVEEVAEHEQEDEAVEPEGGEDGMPIGTDASAA